MSMQVSYKKQALLFLIFIIIIFIVVEGIVRTFDVFSTTCNFVDNEIFNSYDMIEKKQMCFEYTTIKTDFSQPIRLLVPNQNGEYININSDGFRGKNISNEKSDYRIFVVGGSTTFGFVTSSDDLTIPGILEKKLLDDGVNVEIINAGIPGAYSRDEVYLIENFILKFSPDMIIMYDGANDGGHSLDMITDEEFKKNNFYLNNNLITQNNTSTGLLTFFAKIDFHTGIGLIQFFKSIYAPISKENISIETEIETQEIIKLQTERLEKNWDKVCIMGKEHQIKIVNIIQPLIGTGNRTLSDSEKLIIPSSTNFLNSLEPSTLNINSCEYVLDLRSALDETSNIPVFFDSTHMTDFGNKIVAERIYREILPIIKNDLITN